MGDGGGWVGGGVPSDYFVSTQLQLWLFCCWGCGCCWAVTISESIPKIAVNQKITLFEVSKNHF